ncbi:MAG TPA: TetR-like C-terminal domain-containing protein, partial [Solirubrobacteraceae bacterium]|nr:TetR-like C-terminal domain-containing protein [Solirubrobacteraceae bacterium]
KENAHLAAGLTQHLRESPRLGQVFREEIMVAKRAHFESILRRAVDRGELARLPRDVPLLADLGPSVIHSRALITGESLDRRFVNQLVDHVLIPALRASEVRR